MGTQLWTGDQAAQIMQVIKDQRLTVDQAQDVLSGPLSDVLEAGKRGKLKEVDRDELRRFLKLEPFFPEPTISTFTLTVNYDLTVEELVAAGKYDGHINPNITSQNFPSSRTGTALLECAYFHFNRVMKLARVHPVLGNKGYRPSELKELLTVGIDRPNDQRQFPIIDTGSVWDGHCPFLSGLSWDRDLLLDTVVDEWIERCRFLAVRESSRR